MATPRDHARAAQLRAEACELRRDAQDRRLQGNVVAAARLVCRAENLNRQSLALLQR